MSRWTFGQKLGAGFLLTLALTASLGVVSIGALRRTIATHQNVVLVEARRLLDVERLGSLLWQTSSAVRGFLLTGDSQYLRQNDQVRGEVSAVLARLVEQGQETDLRSLLSEVDHLSAEYQEAATSVSALRGAAPRIETLSTSFEEQIVPRRMQLEGKLRELLQRTQRALEVAEDQAKRESDQAAGQVLGIALAVAACSGLIAFFLTRLLGRQIADAVQRLQTSSTELQASAHQQATGVKEQATAMSEIATTIGELLATSRQIAKSAESVAGIAEQATAAAGSGTSTLDNGQAALTSSRTQVDLIVKHMLDLGQKSQHIGSVLDIVSELAEQTNILAINATIEAAGAGESGKRFTVVADEIRKLADRVAGSTKEIRGLIDEVRTAVHTTVIATETGSKAVDTNIQAFAAVAIAFEKIKTLVATSSEAAREIHLSTQQQSTAVEQVNIAITSVTQAAQETEASTAQTLQTSTELAHLSRGMLRMIRVDAA